jgi:hypothetical protein
MSHLPNVWALAVLSTFSARRICNVTSPVAGIRNVTGTIRASDFQLVASTVGPREYHVVVLTGVWRCGSEIRYRHRGERKAATHFE